MTRRKMMSASAVAGSLQAQPKDPREYILLRKMYLRNSADNQAAATAEFLEKHAFPAMKRAGGANFGYFAATLAADSPFYLIISSFPSMAAIEERQNRMGADKDYQSALKAFNGKPGLQFVRYETSLLYGFARFPKIATPPEAKAPRMFELRTYESDDSSSLREKVRMFNEGEIDIFLKTGLAPVFFGETVFGVKQPSLTYMLWYDNLAAREANWAKFVSDPAWLKLRGTPGWSDAEIVSNISSSFLRGLPFSPIR